MQRYNQAPLKSDGQGCRTPRVQTEVPGDALTGDGQLQVWDAPEQGGKGNITFQAGQWRSQTGMDAMPKGKMTLQHACNVQLLWSAKLALIVIR